MKILRTILLLTLLGLPVMAVAQNTNLNNPLGDDVYAWDIFARVAGGLSFTAGTFALLFVVIGGYLILTARGNDEQYNKGKKSIAYAIIGMLIVVGSYTILSTTINVLTGAAVNSGELTPFKASGSLIDPLGITDTIPADQSAFVFYGQRIIGYMVNLLGVAVVAMYVYGGAMWMLSAGSDERITQAKKVLTYATIGAAVVLSSYILIKFIYTPVATLLVSG